MHFTNTQKADINPRKEKLFEIDAGHVSSKTELYLNWADAILQEVLLPYWNALATNNYSVDKKIK